VSTFQRQKKIFHFIVCRIETARKKLGLPPFAARQTWSPKDFIGGGRRPPLFQAASPLLPLKRFHPHGRKPRAGFNSRNYLRFETTMDLESVPRNLPSVLGTSHMTGVIGWAVQPPLSIIFDAGLERVSRDNARVAGEENVPRDSKVIIRFVSASRAVGFYLYVSRGNVLDFN